jgi:hypothetical protein
MVQHSVCPNSRQGSKTSHWAAATHHPEPNTTKIGFFRRNTAVSASIDAFYIRGLREQIRYLADQSNINRILPPNNEFKRLINRKTMEIESATKIDLDIARDKTATS